MVLQVLVGNQGRVVVTEHQVQADLPVIVEQMEHQVLRV